ncbi:phage tail-collar fiber domain-containing protein [Serratia fonticola]|uniref:Phage tail protein n=1 Tax=Serratia fonticola TaxID=47917 RepID=A0AAW3WTD4_SERFO|nr:phage tail protein [Serratia fonticola]MBC3212927.1 phage tail protein [Serratia fonticola]NYA14491.1 phage tail protein [Serratia fonticola]NYA34289.1 phage tail protein [Serratia fonticola]
MSKYKAILTTAGAAKIAAASAGGKPLKIDRMAVGDGNGKLPTPNPAQTKLVNERHRAALNSLTVDKAAPDRLIAELVIPANVGGFWLREMGLYDADGTLIALSNMAESYKPKLEEGSGRTQTLRMVVIVSHTEAITLIVSGDMVMATRDFVAAAITDHAKSRNHPDATTAAKGFVQLSSVTNSTSEALAATPKAVKAVNDAAVKLAQNLADLPDKAKARVSLGLKSAALRDTGEATGQVLTANKAFGLGLMEPERRHRLADLAGANAFTGFTWTKSDDPDAPPFTGTVGIINHAWRASPTAAPYALQMGWRDGRMAFRTKESNKDFLGWCELLHTGNGYTAAQCDGKYALRSIKVNGKPLSADVNLLAGDVNAWNKTEADARYLKLSGGTVKNLTVKTGSTGTENTSLLIDGVEHTPLVLKRSSATANLSIGFQLGGNAPLYRLGINDKNNLSWGTDANQASNATIYHTKNKPTATDVGALTDAQAVQKYALRSIKVNGKPISADVNLQAGDVNAWNKTEADNRYLLKTGGIVSGKTRFAAGVNFGNENTSVEGGSDAAGYTSNNLMLKSWYGIGFFNTCTTTGVQGVSGFINTRNGDLQMKRNIAADAQIIEAGKRVYSPNNKPTAADVGALTDAQATQKYALRSIKVNGKPLSGDVNLVAGDINAYTKAEADGRYLMKSGGQLTGTLKTSAEIQSTTSDNYRLVGGDYGTYWRNDGNSLYLLMTNAKNQYGAYNGLRPLAVNVKNGDVVLGHNAIVSGNLKVGQATHSADGNIMGSRWGNKWLWDAIVEQVNGRVDWGSFNNRSHVAGNRQAWWYKDELTGFIFQDGVVNRGEGYLTWVGFPRGYTQDCFGVQLTLAGHWGDSNMNMEAQSLSAGGFNAALGDNERVVFWWAVGV